MRALIQRVSQAAVSVNDDTVGQIGPGLVVLIGISRDDQESDADYIVSKTLNLRRSEEHTSELQSRRNLVCRLLLEKKKTKIKKIVRSEEP